MTPTVDVFVEPSGRRIAPFGDPVTETPIANRPLSAWQEQAFADGGFRRVDAITPPCLVIPDTLFCTGDILRRFVDGAAGGNAVLVLAESKHGASTTPVQPHVTRLEGKGWRFEKIRYVAGGDQAPADVVVEPQERVLDLPSLPYDLGQETIQIGIARDPLMTLHHWVHILWANQAAGGIELMRTPPWKWALRGLWAATRALSFNKWKVLGKLNRIGKGCDIHPTAVVEGSTLGDGVSVGPFSRVLFSTLGDGVSVMPHAQVDLSTVGAKATISEATVIRFSVIYPEAVVSQYLMQQCVIGRRAVTTGGSFSIDLNFEQDIRVPLDGKLWSTGQRFLGSAFGHRARIGTGFWLASGRMVPNDYFLVRDP
ncbi:MAG: hypothetical protein KC613_05745, partial [Myxococcales bacterium]|nr:hypothetical protein [Myxococcales bacterium]